MIESDTIHLFRAFDGGWGTNVYRFILEEMQ